MVLMTFDVNRCWHVRLILIAKFCKEREESPRSSAYNLHSLFCLGKIDVSSTKLMYIYLL